MTRRTQILVIAVLGISLIAPLTLMAFGVRPDVDENRALTDAPDLSFSSVFDEATWAQAGLYLTDRLPLRDVAIEADTDLRESVAFVEVPRNGVLRGRDGWLYYSESGPEAELECEPSGPDDFLAAARKVADLAEQADLPFAYVFIPDKVVVYPQHRSAEGLAGLLGLGDDEVPGCKQVWLDALDAQGSSHPWLVDLAPGLIDAAGGDGPLLYRRTDTHWNDPGALHYSRALLDRFAPEIYDPAEFVDRGTVERGGDLNKLLGHDAVELVPHVEVVRPGVEVERSNPATDDGGRSVWLSEATSADAPLVEGVTVIIGDSFTRTALRVLEPYFEELVFVNREAIEDRTFEGALQGREPDRIVIAQVQRNLAKGQYLGHVEPLAEYLERSD